MSLVYEEVDMVIEVKENEADLVLEVGVTHVIMDYLPLSSYVDEKTVERRHNPLEEFQKLTQTQRSKVIKLCKKKNTYHTSNSYDT